MYDFVRIVDAPSPKSKFVRVIYPKFVVSTRSKDLMIRGGDFYAVYDNETKLWSTSEDTVIETIDRALEERKKEVEEKGRYDDIIVQWMWDSDSKSIDKWHKFVQRQMRDNFKPLDEKVIFANTKIKKTDYASKVLEYAKEEGDISAYDELIGTLYDEENRRKLEWAVGAIISGDSKHIQKFEVLYGSAGSGKSTFLNIVQWLFDGYYSTFDAKELASANNAFALESFKSNPLVSIQHDGDLSRIEDNTKLNSIVSHELMEINEKFAKKYTAKFNSFLFMGTNKPVKITEAKSGLLRRLIDVHPSGNKVPYKRYQQLMGQIKFELGAIAYHCESVYKELGEDYYESYIPIEMMSSTNDFFDFMQSCYDDFVENDHVTLTEAWKRYKEYCDFANAYQLPLRTVRVELRNYFTDFQERAYVGNVRVRNLYSGFIASRFESGKEESSNGDIDDFGWLKLNSSVSIFDKEYKDWPAQYETDYGKGAQPETSWDKCKTKLCDLDTWKTHYTKPPKDLKLVMADFDLRDENGEKSLELNLEAASKWPKTYAELSKSGGGIHLYYSYDGDISKLSRVFAEGIEIKVFNGNAAIRRRLSLCNTEPIATISSGLPLKGEKKKNVNWDGYKDAKHLKRHLETEIQKNLKKGVHADTTSSIHMIKKILDDAYESGIPYNVIDLYPAVRDFAAASTNQSDHCLDCVAEMKFRSDPEMILAINDTVDDKEPVYIVLDTEIYPPSEDGQNPGLFLVCWKYLGADDKSISVMVNPTPEEVEELFKYKMIVYNGLDYDCYLLMARSMGENNAKIYDRSNRIINLHDASAKMYYARKMVGFDVYEYCKAAGKGQSLKAWEVELGQSHMEMGIRWDKPAPMDKWDDIIEYCKNDVLATEAVFNATSGYRHAREFQVALVKALHGDDIPVTPADTANTLTKRAIFGKERNPQGSFNYRDLSKPVGSDRYEEYLVKFGANYPFRVWNAEGLPEYRDYIPGETLPDGWSILPFFPGYEFNMYAKKSEMSTFHGDHGGEGGRTYSVPGGWVNVLDLDIASQYPRTMKMEVILGPEYEPIYDEIVDARVAVKHKDFDTAGKLLSGALKPFLVEEDAPDLAQGMKIIANAAYGLTTASFPNEFKDPKNIDNIVAKRGNLFMLVLKEQIEQRGYKVVHIKTDSIKIANADDYIKEFAIKFAKEYGYDFEVEGEFEKFVLLNDASYVAYDKKEGWITRAAQFQEPYVKKTLFTKEKITFDDMCQTFNVHSGGAIYIDTNEGLPDVSEDEKELEKLKKDLEKGKIRKGYASTYEMERKVASLEEDIKDGHNYIFVGKVGRFCPVVDGSGGGYLYRLQDDKYYSLAGTSGYRWLESEYVEKYGLEKNIDLSYFRELVDEAAKAIGKYVDLDWFLNGSVEEPIPDFINIPEGTDEVVVFET